MTARPRFKRWYWRTYPAAEITSLVWLARMKLSGKTIGGTTKVCDWCEITLTGFRRWRSNKCRTCAPHYRDAGIYLTSGKPPFRVGERRGQIDHRRFRA